MSSKNDQFAVYLVFTQSVSQWQ